VLIARLSASDAVALTMRDEGGTVPRDWDSVRGDRARVRVHPSSDRLPRDSSRPTDSIIINVIVTATRSPSHGYPPESVLPLHTLQSPF